MKKLTFQNSRLVFTFAFLFLSVFQCRQSPPDYIFLAPALKQSLLPFLFRVNTADSLAVASSADYNDNRNGLVTGRTLSSLATNWNTQKPAGITGKLIILQIQAGQASGKYVPTNTSTGVYSYLVNPPSSATESSIFGQTRNNGLVDTETMVPTLTVLEAFLSSFGINPNQDLVILAMDSTSATNFFQVFRAYYALRYWGMERRNIAILNGSIDQLQTLGEVFTVSARNTAVRQDFVTIRNAYNDNTILQATFADVIHAVRGGISTLEKVSPVPSNGVVLWDLRSNSETTPSSPNPGQTPILTRTCTAGAGNCRTPIDGSIRNAVLFSWNGTTGGGFTDGLVNNGDLNSPSTLDLRFKSLSAIRTLLSAAGIDGSRQVISYCSNGQRGAIGLFVANSILGYGSRLYDGSWVEWSSFAARANDDITWTNLPTNSPWRTDQTAVSSNLVQNSSTNTIPNFSYSTTLAFSRSTSKITEDDKASLRGSTSGSSSSGSAGGASAGAGGNACGG